MRDMCQTMLEWCNDMDMIVVSMVDDHDGTGHCVVTTDGSDEIALFFEYEGDDLLVTAR